MGLALALPSISKTQLERVSKDKCSSVLGLIVSDEGKKFFKILTRISMTLGMNLGRWQQMKTPTMVMEIRVSLKHFLHWRQDIWQIDVYSNFTIVKVN